MYLDSNIHLLASRFPELCNNIRSVENQLTRTDIGVEPSRNGDKTLFAIFNEKIEYLHSRYDPLHEADQWIKSYESQIEQYDHLLFYGIGLGYHVEKLVRKYPDKSFSLYEPNVFVFYQYLQHGKMYDLPQQNLKSIYVDFVSQMVDLHLPDIVNEVNGKSLLITHPAYPRLFSTNTVRFETGFKEMLKNKKSTITTNYSYQRIWLVNSLHNFYKITETPNILREKKEVFQNKPVILVSAGPSLNEELEKLRYIKENKLAYIFAVGSANRSLINHGIYPDAVTSYDPNYNNYTVFQEIIDQNIKDIPLIFGSSGNYKTVQLYPGPQMHMFIAQDTVSPYYLGEEIKTNGEVLNDAPSIAVVTLELLYKLGANPIILVGQNFGYRNEEYFAKGIEYDFRPSTLTEQEKLNVIMVEGADGGLVATGSSHNLARSQMEVYTQIISRERKVWNTTKGGAKIAHTEFKELDSILREYLSTSVVQSGWYSGNKTEYEWSALLERSKEMEKEHEKLAKIIDDMVKMILKISVLIDHRELHKLERAFFKFDSRTTDMQNNKYYQVFLRPMTRTAFEAAERTAKEIRQTADLIQKGHLMLNRFGSFVEETRKLYIDMIPLYMHLNQLVNLTADEELKKQPQEELSLPSKG